MLLRDYENNQIVLEYTDNQESSLPFKIVKKRITSEINGDLQPLRFSEKCDRHNQPLYEGDVIKEHDYNNGKNWYGLIEWNSAKGQFIESITKAPLATINSSRVEKIGNIWENPDLAGLLPKADQNSSFFNPGDNPLIMAS